MLLPSLKFYTIAFIIVFICIIILSIIGTIFEQEIISYFGKESSSLALYSLGVFLSLFVILVHIIFTLFIKYIFPNLLSKIISSTGGNGMLQKIYSYFHTPLIEYFIILISFGICILGIVVFSEFRHDIVSREKLNIQEQ